MAERDTGPDEGVITRRTAMLGAGGVGVFGVLWPAASITCKS